jgi:hypothetical protein
MVRVYFDAQSALSILTDDTFRVFAPSLIRVEAEPLVVVAAALDAVSEPLLSSIVPVTSTRCPMWFFNSLSRPSRT